MENRYYSVDRDDVYVGKVIKVIGGIYRYEHVVDDKPLASVEIDKYERLRNMLFVPTEEGLSEDLLYRSPNYPVFNVTTEEKTLALAPNTIAVKDACNLGCILKVLGMGETVLHREIAYAKKILTQFFGENERLILNVMSNLGTEGQEQTEVVFDLLERALKNRDDIRELFDLFQKGDDFKPSKREKVKSLSFLPQRKPL